MTTYHEVTGDHPELEEFAKGEWVLYAQQLLQKAGFEPQDHKIDGLYGPNTKEAVRDFQGARGLKVDGVIGADTWAALEGKTAVIQGAGSTGHLEFDQQPYVNGGWLVWTVKNVGSATVGAGTAAGQYEMYDANNATIPGGTIPLAGDLAPGQSSGNLGANLMMSTPNNGDYGASVQLNSVVSYADYQVANGTAVAK